MTRIKVTSQPYWLASPRQTPANFLPARGRINDPQDGEGGREAKAAGSRTGLPQAEQKRASTGNDTPHPEQYKAIGASKSHGKPVLLGGKWRFQVFAGPFRLRRLAVLAEHDFVLPPRHISLIQKIIHLA
jgi:hypothetical protein